VPEIYSPVNFIIRLELTTFEIGVEVTLQNFGMFRPCSYADLKKGALLT